MKVLQVNCVYKKGSTGKIVYDIHTGLLKLGYGSVVCYGRGETIQDSGIYKNSTEFYSHVNKFISLLTGIMYGGCFFSTNKLISVIKKENPDVVHLHCINGNFVNIYRLISWLKQNKVKTVLTLHAEFMYSGGCGHAFDCGQWRLDAGCGHSKCPRAREEFGSAFLVRTSAMWRKMKKAFDGFDTELVVVSPSYWLDDRASSSPVLKGKKHRVIMNGVDTDNIFHPAGTGEISSLKQELNIGNGKTVFHATPEFSADPGHIKGGYYLIELAKRMPEVKFVVAGSAADGIRVPDNVILLGPVSDQKKLAALYSMADLTVLTSRKETFSMVTAESLCCGTPVVGFRSGAPEQIALAEYSDFVEYGDIDALCDAIGKYLGRCFRTDIISLCAKEKYSKTRMLEEYLNVYSDITKGS